VRREQGARVCAGRTDAPVEAREGHRLLGADGLAAERLLRLGARELMEAVDHPVAHVRREEEIELRAQQHDGANGGGV